MTTKKPTRVKGYDGRYFTVGDRIEIHPGTDLWMRGARYGTVVGFRSTPKDRVHVQMDKLKSKRSGSADTFRKLPPTELEKIMARKNPARRNSGKMRTYATVRQGWESGDYTFAVASGDWGGEGNAYKRDGNGLYGGTAPHKGAFPPRAHDAGSRYYFGSDLAALLRAPARRNSPVAIRRNSGVRMARRPILGGSRRNPAGVDQDAARELEIYIDTSSEPAYKMRWAVAKNLINKKAAGTYRAALADKAFLHVANLGAQLYTKDFLSRGPHPHKSYGIFSLATRKAVAVELRKAFEANAPGGTYDSLLFKKYRNPGVAPALRRTKRRTSKKKATRGPKKWYRIATYNTRGTKVRDTYGQGTRAEANATAKRLSRGRNISKATVFGPLKSVPRNVRAKLV